MKQNTSFDFTASEVLDALTDAIKKEHRYNYNYPDGVGIRLEPLNSGGFRVIWGDKPEEVELPTVTTQPQPALMES